MIKQQCGVSVSRNGKERQIMADNHIHDGFYALLEKCAEKGIKACIWYSDAQNAGIAAWTLNYYEKQDN